MKTENQKKRRFLVGVDEAGRGPLAGPVAVGVAVVPFGFDWNLIRGVGDSKAVSPKLREAIFGRAKELKRQGLLDFTVSLISARVIDRIGIVRSVEQGIERGMQRLSIDPCDADVRLDGLLRAPASYVCQKTIIKGDAKEMIIGLASIVAKVIRDRHMERLSRSYPQYGFDAHKGYGTPYHRRTIVQFSLSPIHRKTYCRRIISQYAQVSVQSACLAKERV